MNKGILWAIVGVLALAVAVLATPAMVGIKELAYSRPFREARNTLKAEFPPYPGTKIVRQGKDGGGGMPMHAPPLCRRSRLFHYKEIVLDVGALKEKARLDSHEIHEFYAQYLRSLGFRVWLSSYEAADNVLRFTRVAGWMGPTGWSSLSREERTLPKTSATGSPMSL